MDVIIGEILNVGRAGEEPDQFMDDAAEKDLFCGKQRKSLREVKAYLSAENALKFDAGGMAYLPRAVFHDVLKEIEILVFGMFMRR